MNLELKNAAQLAEFVIQERKRQHVSQTRLSQLSNVGVRFVRDLEDGKPSLHLEKTLNVLETLGVKVELSTPD
ncbi:MAG: helix-turn-helix transcriptional regulator [Lentisphaeria bacterium]|nr:helix-turn-helix transcriptional regulator [Lentisphaeria bacterium]